MADLQIVISALNQASSELKRVAGDLNALDKAAGKTGNGAASATGKFNKFRSVLQATGLQSTTLGAQFSQLSLGMSGIGAGAAVGLAGITALGAGIAVSTKQAIGFETQITKVAKTAGFSAEQTKEFSDEVLNLARRLPVSITGLTEVAAVAGQLGLSGPKAISRFTEEVAKLSSTTGVAAGDIATSLGTITQVFGLPIERIGNLSSAITELGNTSNSTESQILEFMTRLAGVSKALGIGPAALAGISSAFAAAGVEAERGATAIQNILIAIQEAAQQGGAKLETFGKVVGLTSKQFADLVKNDPTEAFTRFIESLRGVENVTEVLDALGIADSRLVGAALSVANSQESVRDSIETATNAAIRGTATNEEFARSSATTAARLQLLKNNLNAIAITVGSEFLPAVNNIALGLIKVTEGLREIGPEVDAIVEAFKRALAISFDGWVQAFNTVRDSVKGLNGAVKELTTNMPLLLTAAAGLATAFIVFTPGGALLVGLGAVIVAFGVLTADTNTASDATLELKRAFLNAIVAILDALRNLAEALKVLDKFIPGSPFADWAGDIRAARNEVFLLGEEIDAIQQRRQGANEAIQSAQLDPRFQLPEGDPRRTAAELELLGRLKRDFGVDVASGTTGGGGGPSSSPPDSRTIPGLGDQSEKTGNQMSYLEKVMAAVSDGAISLAEKFELGLTDQQVVTLELAAAQGAAADEAFRNRIELMKLAALFPGLTGQEVEFRLGLAAIQQHLQDTGESIEQFILDTSTAALDGFKQAFDAIFSKPTKEDSQLQLQLLEAQRRRLLAGEGATDAQKKAFDAEIKRLQNLIAIRQNADEITKTQAELADNTALTDQAQATAADLYIAAIGKSSDEVVKNTGIVFLQTLANIGLKNQTLELTTSFAQLNDKVNANVATNELSLADALKALAALPDHGASLIPSHAMGVTNFAGGLAKVHRDELLVNLPRGTDVIPADVSRGLFRGAGESGIQSNTQIYVTVEGDATERTVEQIKKAVRDEVEAAQRRAAFRGSYVTSGAYTPA